MTRLEIAGAVLGLLLPVGGGAVWVGAIDNRVETVEKAMEVQKEDHDRLIRIEEKVDQLIKEGR